MKQVKYKGQLYDTGNEYHGLVELYQNKKLVHIVKRRKNGTYLKWYK